MPLVAFTSFSVLLLDDVFVAEVAPLLLRVFLGYPASSSCRTRIRLNLPSEVAGGVLVDPLPSSGSSRRWHKVVPDGVEGQVMDKREINRLR